MTYIEFFDRDEIVNVCACMTYPPDKVILVGNDKKRLQKSALRYERILFDRGDSVLFECRQVSRNDLREIVNLLSDIVENNDDCVFDLTGGEELYLVAVGIVSQKFHEKKIRMQRINLNTGKTIDCDQDGLTVTGDIFPKITVEEQIRIYGGKIMRYSEDNKDGTYSWDLGGDFRSDILRMWTVCTKYRSWNEQMTALSIADAVFPEDQTPTTIAIDFERFERALEKARLKCVLDQSIFRELIDAGLITSFKCSDDRLDITFKSEQVKRCLTKAGQALEMLVYMAAVDALDERGLPKYNDVLNGVFIDWDGREVGEREANTENEIDVMMMRGVIPVFVSCKNGKVEREELYKLSSVADEFGGEHARKVLVVSYELTDKSLVQRAVDMNIKIIDNVKGMTVEQLKIGLANACGG